LIAERLLELREPGQVALSPDGTRICFVVTAAAAERGLPPESRLWLGDLTGGGVEALTDATGSDRLPAWSPDSDLIAFASDRAHPGRFSLHLLAAAGRATRAVGEIPGTIERIEWAADGSELLVLAADLDADGAGSEGAKRIDSGTDPWVKRPAEFWRRLYRVARDGSTLEVPLAGANVWEFAAAGSGQVAALVSDDPAEDAWYDAEVAVISLADGAIRTVRDPRRQTASVAASPNGNRVAFIEGLSSDRGLVAGIVHVVDLDTGEVSELPAAGEDVTFVGWRDDASLWVAGWRSLGSVCGILTMSDEYEELWGGDAFVGEGFGASFAATADGSLLASVLTAPALPPEVVTLAVEGEREWVPLTSLNDRLHGDVDSPSFERLAWTAPDGLGIEGLLLLPPRFERGAELLPLVVIVHGGPTSQWINEFAPSSGLAHILTEARYAVLLPNLRGSAGRGDAFVTANLGDLGGGDLSDVVSGVDACVALGVADPARVGVIGQSYGGFMAAWAAVTTDRFAAAVACSCISDWFTYHLTSNVARFDELFLGADAFADPTGLYRQRSPVFNVHHLTPTLIIHGELDLCTPPGQGLELYRTLVAMGGDAEYVVYPREGHWCVEREHRLDYWARIGNWFDRHLKGERG
jgi:dipeptidyl aminopeptidase/acylaminoacyl peptidase